MPKATPRPRRTVRAAKRPSYVGGQRFESVNDPATATNEEHVALLLRELPYFRFAIAFLNMNDRELEAKLRAAGEESAEEWVQLGENLVAISRRWQDGADIAKKGAARLLVVLDRLTRGPDTETAHA